MEYLMTYGWAILIIAVVLAALFSLNVFNAGAQLGTSCIGQPGFSCSSPVITQNGILSFTLGQGTGYSAYNAYISCVSSANSVGASAQTYNVIYANGIVSTLNAGQSNTLNTGSSLSISSLECYPGPGTAPLNYLSPIGTGFTGVMWLRYNASTTSGASNLYIKIATVSVKSSS
jgi:hypothetical protein